MVYSVSYVYAYMSRANKKASLNIFLWMFCGLDGSFSNFFFVFLANGCEEEAMLQVESASRPLCGFWMVDDQQLGN
jgi:hypothetical protein